MVTRKKLHEMPTHMLRTTADIAYKQALGYAKKRYYEKAIIACSKSLEIDQKFAKAYVMRAVLYMFGKEYGKSFADLESAGKVDSGIQEMFQNAELAYGSGGNYEEKVATVLGFIASNLEYLGMGELRKWRYFKLKRG